jgi:type I restriction enzyme S subunit
MNAARLLSHYEQIADAPDEVDRLRRFALDLAVRGKLVPQDSNDEPASELLKRIAKERARLGIKHVVSPVGEGEVPFDLPLGWSWSRIGEVCSKTGSGSTPRGGKEVYQAIGVPFLRSQNVYDDGLRLNDVAYIDQQTHSRMSGTAVFPGDLLLNITGGSMGRCCRVPDDFKEANVSQHVAIIRTAVRGIEDFLHRLVLSPYFQAFVFDEQTGAGRGGLPKNRMDQIAVALPPLSEQHRIVAKVDELMGLCDRLEAARGNRERVRARLAAASLARLNAPDPETFQADARFALDALPALTARPDQIKQLRQTILNLAVRGKLVAQDPNDEPAAELLKRIATERMGPQAVKKARRNGEVEISSLLAGIPLATGWRWTNIDEIALSMRYGTSTKCEYATPGVPVLRIPNVSDGVVSLDDIKFGPLTEGEIRDLALTAGDLLMIRSNGSLDIVGRSAVVTAKANGMAFAGYLVRLRLSLANIKPEYVWLALNSTDVRDQIEKPIRSAVGLKNVNLTEFGALTFPLPPLAEQHRIVAKVDALMGLCDRLEASLTATTASRRRLLDALLAEVIAPAEDRELEAAE